MTKLTEKKLEWKRGNYQIRKEQFSTYQQLIRLSNGSKFQKKWFKSNTLRALIYNQLMYISKEYTQQHIKNKLQYQIYGTFNYLFNKDIKEFKTMKRLTKRLNKEFKIC